MGLISTTVNRSSSPTSSGPYIFPLQTPVATAGAGEVDGFDLENFHDVHQLYYAARDQLGIGLLLPMVFDGEGDELKESEAVDVISNLLELVT